MKFKGLYAEDQFFTFENENYQCKDWIIETDNPKLIEFLKQNSNFEVIQEPKTTKG